MSNGAFTVRWEFPARIHDTLTLSMTSPGNSIVRSVMKHCTDASGQPDHTDLDMSTTSFESRE